MASAEFFTGAHDITVTQSTFNAAGGHIYNSYYYNLNHSLEEKSDLATLRPIERRGYTHRRMEGTRKDVLQQISSWFDDFAAPNILLLSGSPGAGKSTIAATIVSNLDNLKRLGSSFAFEHSDTGLSDPGAVWRTIASDLTRFHPGVKDSLIRILKGVDPGIADISLQFRRLIEEPLVENHDQLICKPPIIVLDALDECGLDSSQFDQRRIFLDTLKKWSSLSPIFKLIVTSRNERLPNAFRKICTSIVLQTGSRVNAEAENDVRLFFRNRFSMMSEEFPSLSEWPGESKIEQLTRRAAGLFIWADTVIRFVDNGECPPDEQLDIVLAGEVGEGEDIINGLYRRILDVSLKGLKPHVLKAFEAILGTVVLAKVPLFRCDLAHFLAMPITEQVIDFVLNKLSSVILIEENDRRIYICHLSFVDFICDPTRSFKYSVDRTIHSANFATSCFQLMKAGLKFNICGLQTSHLRNVDVPDLQTSIQRCISTRLSLRMATSPGFAP